MPKYRRAEDLIVTIPRFVIAYAMIAARIASENGMLSPHVAYRAIIVSVQAKPALNAA